MTSSRKIIFRPRAQEAVAYWQKTNPANAKKIGTLIKSIEASPFSGLGKPEPLKHEYSGCWSRRIDSEHRLVYKVEDDAIIVLSCRFHYE